MNSSNQFETKVNAWGKVGKYFVIYLDVQGVREILFKDIDVHSGLVSTEKQTEVAHFSDALRTFFCGIAEAVSFVWTRPEEYRDYLLEGVPAAMRRDAEARVFAEIRNLHVGVQQFSDSTLIFVRDEGRVSRIFFEQCMVRCAYEMVKVMGRGLYMRGALSYGTGWEVMSNCLFGPIVQEVYELEQHVANTFRVVITPQFYQVVREELGMLAAGGADMTKPYPFKMIGRDPDGVLSFDYLSEVALENFKRYGSVALKVTGENVANAFSRIAERHRKLLDEVDSDQRKSRLVVKYAMYMSYLESRFKNFEAYGARFVKDTQLDGGVK